MKNYDILKWGSLSFKTQGEGRYCVLAGLSFLWQTTFLSECFAQCCPKKPAAAVLCRL